MADYRYFADIDGNAIPLTAIWHDGSIYNSAKHFTGLTPNGVRVQATRQIEFKRHPSLHKCDARCFEAKGHQCECSCGGKNHGRGA